MKQGCLKDDFIYERKVIYGEYLELRAAIKSLPTTLPIVWMKDSVTLDLREQKYIGSSCNCDQPVLCIKKVTEEDEGFYRIAALNNFEGKYVSDTLKITVNGGKMIKITPCSNAIHAEQSFAAFQVMKPINVCELNVRRKNSIMQS